MNFIKACQIFLKDRNHRIIRRLKDNSIYELTELLDGQRHNTLTTRKWASEEDFRLQNRKYSEQKFITADDVIQEDWEAYHAPLEGVKHEYTLVT